jgi:hypothetical protein
MCSIAVCSTLLAPIAPQRHRVERLRLLARVLAGDAFGVAVFFFTLFLLGVLPDVFTAAFADFVFVADFGFLEGVRFLAGVLFRLAVRAFLADGFFARDARPLEGVTARELARRFLPTVVVCFRVSVWGLGAGLMSPGGEAGLACLPAKKVEKKDPRLPKKPFPLLPRLPVLPGAKCAGSFFTHSLAVV